MELFTRYVIDTNIIIDLSRRIHPARLRREANDVMQELLATGSIVSHKEVFLELASGAKQGDVALAWAKDNESIFTDLTPSQEQQLVKVLTEHPDILDPKKIGHDADPLLVALALDIGGVVVTGDGSTQRSGKKQIKDVCDAYSIRCIDVDEFLTENGWLAEASAEPPDLVGPAVS
jgi:predicted nucleic acid-binding protein